MNKETNMTKTIYHLKFYSLYHTPPDKVIGMVTKCYQMRDIVNKLGLDEMIFFGVELELNPKKKLVNCEVDTYLVVELCRYSPNVYSKYYTNSDLDLDSDIYLKKDEDAIFKVYRQYPYSDSHTMNLNIELDALSLLVDGCGLSKCDVEYCLANKIKYNDYTPPDTLLYEDEKYISIEI